MAEKEQDRFIMFVGPGNPFNMHGVVLERGVVYKCSERVYEWAKAIRGIHVIEKFSKDFKDFQKELKIPAGIK